MAQSSALKPGKRQLLVVLILVLALYVVVPQLGDFQSSWSLLKHPDATWVGVALLTAALTYLAAAMTYCLLAFKRLPYAKTLLVQLAAMFVNRLLPAGVGALGTNFIYLRNQKHTAAQAGTVVGVNNMLGFAGHGILVAITLLFFSQNVAKMSINFSPNGLLMLLTLLAITIVLAITFFVVGKARFVRSVRDVVKQFLSYRRRLPALTAALGSSMVLTLANVGCLVACAAALGIDLSFVTILLIFTFGVGAGTATPTPGGLGGFEAGLVAGFVAYGVDSSAALAAALLFRFITYWLALAAGAVAFVVAQHKKLLIT